MVFSYFQQVRASPQGQGGHKKKDCLRSLACQTGIFKKRLSTVQRLGNSVRGREHSQQQTCILCVLLSQLTIFLRYIFSPSRIAFLSSSSLSFFRPFNFEARWELTILDQTRMRPRWSSREVVSMCPANAEWTEVGEMNRESNSTVACRWPSV